MGTLRDIYLHPLKSCAPLAVPSARVEPRGLADDRRWMLVDAEGRFLTGRQLPALVRLRATAGAPGTLRIEADDGGVLEARVDARAGRRAVTVWKDAVDAACVAPDDDAWLSRRLGRPVHLVHLDAESRRPVDPRYARPGDEVSFADGYPLLLLSNASVAALDARLPRPVGAARFRPNLVVDADAPHAEDRWKRIRVGAVEFDVVKPCTRCVFTTVDPATGTVDPSGEPLATLKGYRRGPSGVTFGQNLVPRGTGEVAIGDRVEVLEHLL